MTHVGQLCGNLRLLKPLLNNMRFLLRLYSNAEWNNKSKARKKDTLTQREKIGLSDWTIGTWYSVESELVLSELFRKAIAQQVKCRNRTFTHFF